MQIYDGGPGSRPGYGQNKGYPVPFMTGLLLAVNIIVFVWLEWNGSTEDGYYMAEHGTLIAGFVLEYKEYYRLLTAFFLHFGVRHLFNNMLLLWYLGMRLERYVGHWRFLFIYLAAGLGGNVCSLIWYAVTQPYVNSAGASGAVFGIVGAMLWVVLRHRGRLEGLTSRQILLMILFSLYNGLSGTGINNVAHVSGLLIGLLLAALLYRGGYAVLPWLKRRLGR
ncbi:MAG: rhomboid family intramembrane serine protease [Lachnospiraceae bacterium]|jgi:rhomboid protease GluP|nr:rhomboid family intramembrane serine protease [Lachnospiraceae bacterium]